MVMPTLQIQILNLRDINWLAQDHVVRIRFKSKSLEFKFSSISTTATGRKPNVLGKKTHPAYQNEKAHVIKRVLVKAQWPSEEYRGLSESFGGAVSNGTPTPQISLIPFLGVSCSLLTVRITPSLHTSITDVCWCVLVLCSVFHVCWDRKKWKLLFLQKKTLGNVKFSVGESYEGLRAIEPGHAKKGSKIGVFS